MRFGLVLILISMSIFKSVSLSARILSAPFVASRLFSSSSMQSNSDEIKGMYTLGVSMARKFNEVKPHISKEELNAVLAGFNDSMLDKVENEGELYSKYGELINNVITKSVGSLSWYTSKWESV